MRRALQTIATAAAIALTLGSARAASADEPAVACVAAHREAQRARAEHHLLEAKEKLLVCGQSACPELIRGDCTQWLAEVQPRIPTVVLGAELDAPGLLEATRVRIDGGATHHALDGKAVAVDPGEHVFRFEVPGRAPVEQRVVVLEGEQARRVFAPSSLAPASGPGSSTRVPPAAIALGAVGLVSLGVFAGFGIAGVAKKNELDAAGCRPGCPPSDVDAARRDFAVADVTLAIGAAAIVAGVVVIAVRGASSSSKKQASSPLTLRF